LLTIVSRRIERCLRSQDLVARLGGDEFAILLEPDTDRADAQAVAQRILNVLAEPAEIEGQQVVSGASIGIAVAPGDGITVESLMKNVDLALYAAKGGGRNRLAFFESQMDEAAQARRLIETDLRVALPKDQLSILYQPLINLRSGEVSGYEALLRWEHPERGLIMPADFIPVAEETGIVVQLGEWVIRNAIAEAATWPHGVNVSVNLSPAQIGSTTLIPTIVNALASTALDPHRLELEITEGVLMTDTEANLSILHRIKALGIRIALDDFGTGYSSLNYLRCFPFDKIKIDRNFVADINDRGDCRAIIRAVTSLASSLGMVTTAEGVENEAQLALLRSEGCMEAQGYLFGVAVSANTLPKAAEPQAVRRQNIWH
jgi:predicted signal transduction protein with EAL and GGDEF domain